jgi:UDP-N-acetylglucosamine--N-acetylmuramyl-(pentapeptide) pyrophosphoryl-undecaprenol N-acetylglucosamine transferase
MTPGLANKIAQRFATKIFTSFEETLNYFPKDKTAAIGSPIRRGILKGSPYKGTELLGFDRKRPVLTVMGGSLGAKKINETIRAALPQLKDYQIIHLCGKGNVDEKYTNLKDYECHFRIPCIKNPNAHHSSYEKSKQGRSDIKREIVSGKRICHDA